MCCVVDFDWSISNDFIVSVSSDGMCRLWDSLSGKCLRVIRDTSGVQMYCCRFHPLNNNLVTVSSLVRQWEYYNIIICGLNFVGENFAEL